jgi:hypothetical protein
MRPKRMLAALGLLRITRAKVSGSFSAANPAENAEAAQRFRNPTFRLAFTLSQKLIAIYNPSSA